VTEVTGRDLLLCACKGILAGRCTLSTAQGPSTRSEHRASGREVINGKGPLVDFVLTAVPVRSAVC